jgi:hypothetical protein
MSPGKKLTPKQQTFLNHYIATGNAMEAYKRAYDAKKMTIEAIRANAAKLLKHTTIALKIHSFHQKGSRDGEREPPDERGYPS